MYIDVPTKLVKYIHGKGLSFIPALAFAMFFISCSDNDKSPESENQTNRTVNVLPSDTANAESLPVNEIENLQLAYTVQEGEQYSYRVRQSDDVVENGMKASQTFVHRYTKRITKVKSDGSIQLTIRIDSLYASNSFQDPNDSLKSVTKSFNSGNASDMGNEQFKEFSSLIGEEVSVSMNKRGQIEEISGLTSIVNKMLGAKKDSVTPAIKNQFAQQLEMQMYRTVLTNEMIPLPDALDSTRSWGREEITPISGVFRARTTVRYTVADVKKSGDNRIASINGILTAEMLDKKSKNAMGDISLKSSSVSGKTKITLNADKGYTIAKRSEIRTSVVATISDAKSGKKMDAAQSAHTVISVELLR